jgi:hypothetical protein
VRFADVLTAALIQIRANKLRSFFTLQVRRLPINLGLIEDADWLRMQRRPKITSLDADG